ncbi:hypothetical protein LguiA_025709 [Lonicera macranthoides]
MQATVKVAEINIRAPNNEAVVKISCCEATRGRSKMNPKMNIISIESLRPTLSTIIPDKTSPGTSSLVMSDVLHWGRGGGEMGILGISQRQSSRATTLTLVTAQLRGEQNNAII